MDKEIKEKQIVFLQTIRSMLSSDNDVSSTKSDNNNITIGIDDNNVDSRIDGIIERIEKIEQSLFDSKDDDGIRKNKIKEEILSQLQQHKKLTSSQLSKIINLSRTRCSEYFRELTIGGKTEGVIINRQKYYKLV
jgi:hypothetical protein